jgi:hypothetical protein
MTTKKRTNPQDATRRNVQAANKKLALLERRVKHLEVGWHDVWAVGARVSNLERRMTKT